MQPPPLPDAAQIAAQRLAPVAAMTAQIGQRLRGPCQPRVKRLIGAHRMVERQHIDPTAHHPRGPRPHAVHQGHAGHRRAANGAAGQIGGDQSGREIRP